MIAYEMNTRIKQVGQFLTSAPRFPEAADRVPTGS